MAKKILFINTTFREGGAAQVARSLFHHLNQSGFDAYFAYGRGSKSGEPKTFKFGNSPETLLHVLMVRILGLEGRGSYYSTQKLINYIKKGNFDLIHLHNLHGYYLNFYDLIKFLNGTKIKVIWTWHDEWALNPLYAHSANSYSYPKTYNNISPRFWFKEKQKVFKSMQDLTIVCTAQWLYERAQKSYLKDSNIHLGYRGVDLELFRPVLKKETILKKYNLPLDKKIILFGVCNLNDRNKGIGYILKVADLLKEKNYLFLGVGKGMILENKNIKIIPYINNRKSIAEIFQAADLFCLTSLAETECLVAREALSSGLPVVAFDIPSTRELLSEEVGSVVPFGNVKKLAEAIVKNLGKNYISKSHSARNLAIYKFSSEKALADYIDLYKEILK